MTKQYLLLGITLLFHFFGQTQTTEESGTGILRGQITDENKLPLPGATVIITNRQIGAITNEDGTFTILETPIGKQSVTIEYLGYKTIKKEVDIISSETLILNITMVPGSNELDEIVILGNFSQNQAKALNTQRTKDNITNIISSSQVGKFPDNNIGDALKRVPGITMQNDQGEARDIIIRGLSPQLSSVTLNGDRIPSAEGSNRRIQMDLIPSNMVEAIEVSKTITPDMEADAIGGSVNLVTRSAPVGFKANITTSGGISPIRSNPLLNASVLLSNRFFNDKFGVVANGGYYSNDYGSDNIEFVWSDDKNTPQYISTQDIRRYDIKRIRKNIALNFDYKINDNNTLFLKSIYNNRKDFENRYRLRYKMDEPDEKGFSETEVRRQTKGGSNNNDQTRLEDQSVYKVSLAGVHILLGKMEVNWKLAYSGASEDRPNERYISFRNKKLTSTQNLSNPRRPVITPTTNDFNTPSELSLKEINEEFKKTKEISYDAKIDVTLPMSNSTLYSNILKIGYKLKTKDKDRNNIFYDYTDYAENTLGINKMSDVETKDKTLNGFLPGNQYKSGLFATKNALANINLNSSNGKLLLEEFVPLNYNAREDINAAYAMIKQHLGLKTILIAGARIEHTNITYTGNEVDLDSAKTLNDVKSTTASKNYTNILPNIQLKYSMKKNTIFRLAYTSSIARPNYYDLVPYKNVLSIENTASFGNPNLKATVSHNFDFIAEHYFENIGIISGGAFYKNLNNFIFSQRSQENLILNGVTSLYQVTRPLNGAEASVIGFEIAFQRRLNFLPSFLKYLSFYGNYTFLNTSTKGIEGRKDGLPLTGSANDMLNTSLAFEKKGFLLRASLNYTGSYIDEYGDIALNDRYYDSQLFLDLNSSYKFSKNWNVFTEFKNLTNQPLRYYQGTKQQTAQIEFYNFNWNVGVKYNF